MNRISHMRDDFQGERSRSQGHVVSQCCTYVITGRRGHTVSGKPGGHTSCLLVLQVTTLLYALSKGQARLQRRSSTQLEVESSCVAMNGL